MQVKNGNRNVKKKMKE